MKILVSWIGLKKDFNSGSVAQESPNYLLHHLPQYSFDKHIVLYNKEEHDVHARLFQQKIEQEFKGRKVELRELKLNDERDLNEVQNKVGTFIKDLEKDEVTILISTGTSVLKIAWYIFTSSYQQFIKLIQYRANHKDFGEVTVQKSVEPYSLMVNEQSISKRKNPADIGNFYESPYLSGVYDRASKIALVENTVLIVGDTGTGKEHLAHFIHDNSARKTNSFVAVNCSSFNDELLSSELFGHVKGAFTGAVAERKGIFEQAQGGTVFLDEIGDVSSFMQQSLLRVLQEKKIQRTGGAGKEIIVDIRVIAATNKNLVQRVAEGRFREDLYYRLAVNELEIPSLQEWPTKEKLDLINFLISKKASELRVKPMQVSKAVQDHLVSYAFPGNIRELENLIAGLYPFKTDKPVDFADLPKRLRDKSSVSLRWEEVEADHIRKVLRITRGNQSEACKQIGYAINTFKTRLKAYNINPDNYK